MTSATDPWTPPKADPEGPSGENAGGSQYKLTPRGVERLAWRALGRRIALLGLVTIVSLGLPYLQGVSVAALVTSLGIVVVIFGGSLFLANQKARRSLGTFELRRDDDRISRRQEHIEDLTIEKKDVTSIERDRQGNLFVRTDGRLRYVSVPFGTERFEQIEAALAKWRPIEAAPLELGRRVLRGATTIASLIGFIIVMNTTNPTWLIGSGVALVALLLLAWLRLSTNPNVERRPLVRTVLYGGLIAFVAFKVIQALGG